MIYPTGYYDNHHIVLRPHDYSMLRPEYLMIYPTGYCDNHHIVLRPHDYSMLRP